MHSLMGSAEATDLRAFGLLQQLAQEAGPGVLHSQERRGVSQASFTAYGQDSACNK
jgi:hypothetical protein